MDDADDTRRNLIFNTLANLPQDVLRDMLDDQRFALMHRKLNSQEKEKLNFMLGILGELIDDPNLQKVPRPGTDAWVDAQLREERKKRAEGAAQLRRFQERHPVIPLHPQMIDYAWLALDIDDQQLAWAVDNEAQKEDAPDEPELMEWWFHFTHDKKKQVLRNAGLLRDA